MGSDPAESSLTERGIHRLGTRLLCWYVLEDGERLTLVDGGLVGYWDQLVSLLARLGRAPAHVEALVISHGHPDHFGIAARLRTEVPDVRILVHEADAVAVTTDTRAFATRSLPPIWRPLFFRYLVHLARNGAFRTPTVADVETFAHGDELDVPGRPRVIHAPGHTPGSSAFLLAEQRALVTGDTLITVDVDGSHRPRVALEATSVDRRAAVDAMDRLTGVEADLILPGHGDPWAGTVGEAVMLARG